MLTFQGIGRLGRLGNQMFQYATLFSIAKKNNYSFGIPYTINKSTSDYHHFCLNDCFNNLSAEDSSNFLPSDTVYETTNQYIPGIFEISDNMNLHGYFQSEKYFLEFKQDICNEFKFKEEITNKTLEIRSQIQGQVISAHIRYGDYQYLTNMYPRLTDEYFLQAFELLPKDIPILIFSDDLAQAFDYFQKFNKNCLLIPELNRYEDMCMMTMCDYHIIANSSFSWWGAWLSNSKKTIAPKNWYGDAPNAPKDWSDIYSKEWTII